MREPFQIIKETEDWIAVTKSAGLVVEKSPFYPSLEEYLLDYLSQKKKNPYIGVVHRLDRFVSGVIIFAKKKSILKKLNASFQFKKVSKSYKAVLENKPPVEKGTLTHWLQKDQLNKKAIVHPKRHAEGKQSILKYEFLEEVEKGFLVEIKLVTGRFHQIRVQFGDIGCPIVGDEKYGAKTPFQENGIALHSFRLEFPDPTSGERVEVISEVSGFETFSKM